MARTMRRSRLFLVFCLPGAFGAAWTVFAGKDVNWDLLNYHYYLPYELLAGRVGQDFFAASAQSYLNPVGYLPFYLMVTSGWHSVVVSMVLAVAHALSISLLFLLAWELFAHLPARDRAIFSGLATAMGAATAVFWPTVGTSFLDPLLVPPMLAGLLLLLRADRHAVGRATLAGALFGAAAALKYSNAIFALAAFPLALAMPGLSAGSRLRAGLGYMAGGALGLAIFAGPWFALLMREFGNPVFPLMNAWFQSPHAPLVNMVSERFTPRDLADVLSFPFRMVGLDRHLYSETFAPDIRLAALIAAVVALPVVVFAGKARQENSLRGADWRVLSFFGLGLVLWLASSTNARYGMVLLLLAGVCLVRIAERVLPARAARIALSVLLLVQVGTSVLASPPRWFLTEPWSKRWLPYDAPERALREPALYLTLEVLPMAVVAPFVHPSSSFVNFRGQHSIPSDSPKLAALLERHRGHVRALGRRLELVDGKPAAAQVKAYDDALRGIGFRVDPEECFTIAWRPDREDALSRAANWLADVPPSLEPLSVVSCALAVAARDPTDVARERQISALFDHIERRCPALFRGQTAVTEPFGSGWSRHYNGLDARLEAYGGGVALHRYRSATVVDLGRLGDWEKADAPLPTACR
ncbi:MAG TPA: hypothetical protein VET51_14250 [Burkholderiales bacterium]|nr:hypothetical protein [Burkholderiales bacterium]